LITIKTITIIGTGNVATHLGKALLKNGYSINQIYSQTKDNAFSLASKLNAMPCDNVKYLTDESDLYLICIKDDFIEGFAEQISFTNKLIVHTSGSISIDVLRKFDHYGILYPLQTFSKEQSIDISLLPFCIEANNSEAEQSLFKLGKNLSKSVYHINSEQRKKIHLAAVFACNFSNYMYTISEDFLTQNNIDFNILKPLILETAKKIQYGSAKSMQTGPANRNDEEVIKNHLEMLANNKDYQDIYKIITASIIRDN